MGSWIGGFVNAGLIAGTALALVPLIIHILNRRRHKPLAWAAMRFVQAAHKKTRRRVRLESWLLLLLRMGGIALLALAAARPFAGEKSPLAGLTESRKDLVLYVDGSASMGWRDGAESTFERAVGRARELLRDLSATRGDRALVILAGARARGAAWTTPDQALSLLEAFAPTEESLDLAAALGAAVDAAEREDALGARGALEVRLLTDMQRRSFLAATAAEGGAPESSGSGSASGASGPAALSEVLDELKKLEVKVLVEDVSPSAAERPNLSIGSVASLARVLGPDQPGDVRIEVFNHASAPRSGVRVVLEVDGERQPAQLVDLPARGRAEAVVPLSFARAGEHTLTARIDGGDRLAFDDARSHVLSVPPPIRILLVNGAPGAIVAEDEVGYLRAVLEPAVDDGSGLGRTAPFEPRTVLPEQLSAGEVDLAGVDVVWLANVESLAPDLVTRLEAFVGAGGALIASLGDRVDAATWNARLVRGDGSGLAPAELVQRVAVPSREAGWFRVKAFDAEHPALEFFSDARFQPLLTEVPIYEAFATRPVAAARVLASLDDELASPLVVERAWDRGRVILITTTIDPAWSRLCESPATLVPFVHELLRHARERGGPPRNVSLGQPLIAEVAQFPRAMTLVRPDGSRRALDGESEDLGGGRWRLPSVPGDETSASGPYRVETEGAGTLHFAVVSDAAEGDLERLEPSELALVHPALVATDAGEADLGALDAAPRQRGELWRWLAFACLAFLVLESLWAAYLGARRRIAR